MSCKPMHGSHGFHIDHDIAQRQLTIPGGTLAYMGPDCMHSEMQGLQGAVALDISCGWTPLEA